MRLIECYYDQLTFRRDALRACHRPKTKIIGWLPRYRLM